MSRNTKRGRDEAAEDELRLFIENDEPTYRQKQYVETALTRKVCKGRFVPRRAADAFKHVTDEAARRYSREYGPAKFPVGARMQVARDMAADYSRRVRRYTQKGVRDLPDEAMRMIDSGSCRLRRG